MDPILLAEIAIVAVIIVLQLVVFTRNNAAIRRLKRIYPAIAVLEAKEMELAPAEEGLSPTAMQIVSTKKFTPIFKEIVRTTNAYLRKNRGAADFDILKEMAEDKEGSLEKAIDANIALPLYIGLLCTFIGVIIGLVKIMTVGVSDAAIQSFVGGVLIGMIGSAMGLALTTRSNYLFKDSKKKRDGDRYEYLSFLRAQILPALKLEPETAPEQQEASVVEIRERLSAFHHGFANYQANMNESLAETLRLFSELKTVFERIRHLEAGLGTLGNALEHNDQLIEKQVAYIDEYAQKAEAFTNILGEHFSKVNAKLNEMSDKGVKDLDGSIRAAYAKMDQYLEDLENGDASKKFIDHLEHELTTIKGEMAQLQIQSVDINKNILKHLEKDDQINLRISQQMEAMNANMKQVLLDQEKVRGSFINSTGFKIFAATGTIAFVLGIAGGIAYVVMNLMP